MSGKVVSVNPEVAAIAKSGLRDITTYQAGTAQASAHRLLQKICDRILKPYGLTKMQWLIIGALYDAGDKGLRITSLTQAIGTTMPYMTTSVNLLESKGVLRRAGAQEDNRSKVVVLASDFSAKCDEIEKTMRVGLRQTIYRDVDPDEFRIYIKVLFQLGKLS